jgi:hypothetical protein
VCEAIRYKRALAVAAVVLVLFQRINNTACVHIQLKVTHLKYCTSNVSA